MRFQFGTSSIPENDSKLVSQPVTSKKQGGRRYLPYVFTEQLKLDLEKYNSQYNSIEVKKFILSHDRFLIIDKKQIYHFGASLKDLAKKWFAFSKFDMKTIEILDRLDK